MLQRGRQRKYLNKHWNAIQRHLAQYLATKNTEELHRLRLELKRISAYCFLLQYCAKRKVKLDITPVKYVFKVTGRIRTSQTNLALADLYQVSDDTFRQKQAIISAIETYDLSTGGFNFIFKKTKAECVKAATDIGNRGLLKFFAQELNAISEILTTEWDVTTFHAIRKRIKRLLYIHEMLNKSLVRALHVNTAYLDYFQEVVGEWHDTHTAMKTIISTTTVDSNNLSLMQNRLNRLTDVILDLSNDFLSKAGVKT